MAMRASRFTIKAGISGFPAVSTGTTHPAYETTSNLSS
jgi:hypothetical protein